MAPLRSPRLLLACLWFQSAAEARRTAETDGVASARTTLTPMTGMFTANKMEYDPLERYANGSPITDAVRVLDLLKDAVEKKGDKLALMQPKETETGDLIEAKKGKAADAVADGKKVGKHKYLYKTWTWKEYYDDVMRAAKAFLAMGLQPMDAVNIRGVNSPEWLITFMGCIAAGGLPVGLYPTDSDDILKFKAEDSGAKFIVVGKSKDLSIYSEFLDELTSVKAVVLWDVNPSYPDKVDDALVERLKSNDRLFLRWGEFLEKAAFESANEALKEAIDVQVPGQAGTVVYTSGTTGNPKGVMLSQDAVTWTCKTVCDNIMDKDYLPRNGHMRILSYLPLNHVAGQMLDIFAPVHLGTIPKVHATLYFPAKCYFSQKCHLEQISDAQPTLFLGVPLVWENMKAKLEENLLKIKEQKNKFVTSPFKKITGVVPGFARKPFRALKGRIQTLEPAKLKNTRSTAIPKLMLKKIGLGKVAFAISGAGPITANTLEFYYNLDLRILNAFGQSESSALGTAWSNKDFITFNVSEKLGSIGKALGNKLGFRAGDDDDDESPDPDPAKKEGEIMLWGRNVMLGYMNDEEKTRETITETGWLKTGDRAKMDQDGFLFLTGRSKDLMKDIGGEMIAPAAVEEGVQAACGQIVKDVIVFGHGKYYLSALLTLPEVLDAGMPTGELLGAAKKVDANAKTVADAKGSLKWEEALESCIKEYNGVAAKGPQKVWRYEILPEDITPEKSPDLMTPTFKIKRDGVAEKYAELIDSCGGDAALATASVKKCGVSVEVA
eukprot:TRINITY_DN3473_c0_g1_i2.p1 TRINITY_DN3473_c0_g1~~TRINITY_DN3473_c0_g1_i2.p1  ORF type:complete len:780 (+),score=190.48 TRINITY_DN3473_c0_g1_i2:58-2397(+)